MAEEEVRFGYLGYSEVTKEILDGIDVSPALTISFTQTVEEEYGRGVSYDEYSPVVQLDTINSNRAKEAIKEHDIDVLLVMGWPELLKSELLNAPTMGCVGRHLSLLPKRRGRAPVAWALIHGLDTTGVSLFWLDEGVDSGDIIAQRKVEIDPNDHAADLHHNCTQASIAVLNEEVIPAFRDGNVSAEPQDHSKATYTHPRRPDMGIIDWTDSAWRVHNFIRGQSHPYPGAFTYHQMDKVTMWYSRLVDETVTKAAPGTVLSRADGAKHWRVQCGEGIVAVEIEHHETGGTLAPGDRLGAIPY